MAADPWHYPRTALATSTWTLLTKGPARALALFGPRRMGKTEFLLKDLGPLAEGQGHRVVYASFWQAPLSPLAVLLHALDMARRKLSLAERIRSGLVAMPTKLELSVPGSPVKAAIDLARLAGPPAPDLLLQMDELLAGLARPKKPTLLLLDEVQELAVSADNKPLIASLRTSLDKRRDGLVVIFTGSSREGLQAMFSARQAAFFQFATPLDLPPLDDGFVDHMLRAFKAATARVLNRADMRDAFATLHRNPAYFRWLLEAMMARPDLTIDLALTGLRDRLAVELRYPQIWLSLNPLQRAVATLLAEGPDKPYGEAARAVLATRLGTTAPTIAAVQSALRRLASQRLADKWDGRWLIDDPEFAAWLRERVGQDGRI
jgi:uncharacterized protein